MFIVTPETARILVESWDDFVYWMKDHPLFFGCSGIIAWIIILGLVIRWLILHVRFV